MIVGGLLLGTLPTLHVIPAAYTLLVRERPRSELERGGGAPLHTPAGKA